MLSQEEQATLDSYNNIAGDWAAQNSTRDFWADEFLKFSLFLPAGLVLDVGCGPGRDSQWFIGHGYQYIGVDGSEKMINIARTNNPNREFFIQNFYELNFPDGSFDGFWAANSLLHVPKNKIHLALAEINRVSKPGAIGFVSMHEGEGVELVEWGDSGQDRFYAYYSSQEFSEILESQGFEVLEIGKKISPTDPEVNFLEFFVKKA